MLLDIAGIFLYFPSPLGVLAVNRRVSRATEIRNGVRIGEFCQYHSEDHRYSAICKLNKSTLTITIPPHFVAGKPREILAACKLSKEILSKNTNYLDNVLETLDIQQHTIGVMFVIAAKFTALTVNHLQLPQ